LQPAANEFGDLGQATYLTSRLVPHDHTHETIGSAGKMAELYPNRAHPMMQLEHSLSIPSAIAAAENRRWFAVYTSPRHEKSVARHFETRSLDTFLPLYNVTRHWKHRQSTFQLPLFPSYIFVRIAPEERMKVLTSPGVLYIVSTKGVPAEIQHREIEALRILLASRKAYPVADYLQPGSRVRFSHGIWAGFEGSISRSKGATRVIVCVDTIMRSLAIEVDSDELELISNGTPPHIYPDSARFNTRSLL
jgi:transcription antitermination factor NusG